ncbi:MAG: SRPBCC family protein [Actinomycetota bacterium]
MNASVDANAVVCEIIVGASPETVFPFLTDPEKIIRWMGESAKLVAQPGGVFAIDISSEHLMRGEFIEVEPNRSVTFSFGWEGQPIGPGSTTVKIELIPQGKSTLVRLTHSDLPEPARAEHGIGWNYYLARLQLVVLGKDPGPDKNNM